MGNEYGMPEAPPMCVDRRDAAGPGVGFGTALIVIGAFALGLRFVPGASLVTMWPLLFVAGGLVQMVTPSRYSGWSAHRFAEGAGTALFGVVLLACTTGYVAWSMWFTLLALWPLLLVVAGLRILGRASGQAWLAALATLIVWGALLFSAAGSWTGDRAFEPLSSAMVHSFAEAPEAAATALSENIVDIVVGPLSRTNR